MNEKQHIECLVESKHSNKLWNIPGQYVHITSIMATYTSKDMMSVSLDFEVLDRNKHGYIELKQAFDIFNSKTDPDTTPAKDEDQNIKDQIQMAVSDLNRLMDRARRMGLGVDISLLDTKTMRSSKAYNDNPQNVVLERIVKVI